MNSVPLDSFRLARYARSVSCFICGEENLYDADRCRHCRAPLALTYQIANQRGPPRMMAVLAPPGSGKTVYLGIVTDILARRDGAGQLTARGAFSVALWQAAVTNLTEGWYPQSTHDDPSGWSWVHCRLAGALRRPVEVIVPDISGRAMERELECPHSQPFLNIVLRKCGGAAILLDAGRLAQGDRAPDFFALKCITYLSELNTTRRGWSSRPIAIVLSKSDAAPDAFTDPRKFLRRCAPGTWHQIREHLQTVAFFATATTAGTAWQRVNGARVAFPLRVEPRGVVEPIEWLIPRLR